MPLVSGSIPARAPGAGWLPETFADAGADGRSAVPAVSVRLPVATSSRKPDAPTPRPEATRAARAHNPRIEPEVRARGRICPPGMHYRGSPTRAAGFPATTHPKRYGAWSGERDAPPQRAETAQRETPAPGGGRRGDGTPPGAGGGPPSLSAPAQGTADPPPAAAAAKAHGSSGGALPRQRRTSFATLHAVG